MKVYCLRYNNYYNRDIKKFDTLSQYEDANCIVEEATQYNCNFKENDGVSTEQTINIVRNIDTIDSDYSLNCNYVLVTDNTNKIISRWFVIDIVKVRDLQFKLQLRRDLIADNYDAVVWSPCMIDKGIIKDATSPLIYKPEPDVQVNEIKQSQTPLYDYTGTSWICMYMTNSLFKFDGLEFSTAACLIKSSFSWDSTTSNVRTPHTVPNGQTLELTIANTKYTFGAGTQFYANFRMDNTDINKEYDLGYFSREILGVYEQAKIMIGNTSNTQSLKMKIFTGYMWDPTWKDGIYEAGDTHYNITEYVTLDFTGNALRSAQENPYTAIMMPYKQAVPVSIEGSNLALQNDPGLVLTNRFSKYLSGSKNLMDIQILPYVPSYFQWQDNRLQVRTMTDVVKIGMNGNTQYALLANPRVLQFTNTIEYSYNVPDTILDKKIAATTKKMRLNSGNHAASYEFKPIDNDGLQNIKVCCVYQPYNPYIYIAPIFKEGSLYGNDYNDARGLVCNGDYSITQTTDEWQTYQMNNKNYQMTFNNQIQDMQAQGEIAINKNIWNQIGQIGTNVALAMALGKGSMGVASLIAGGVSTISSAVADKAALRQSVENAAKNFDLETATIKAKADTVNNVNAIADNNVLVPYLEEYDCTDKEKQALRNKIKYTGMTIGTIGRIADYKGTTTRDYVQGTLIRIDGFNQESNMLLEINNELQKGVFI